MSSWFTQENIFNLISNLAITSAALVLFIQKTKQNMDKYISNYKTDVAGKIKRQAQIDADILNRMNEVRDLVNGDRIAVFEFHNQEHYANGREALRMTCTYESCKSNLIPIKSKMVGIGLSQFPTFLNLLFEKDILYWSDLEEIRDKLPTTYAFFSQFDIHGIYCHVLKNQYEQPIGFIAVIYDKPVNIQLEVDAREVYKLSFYIEEQINNMSPKNKNK